MTSALPLPRDNWRSRWLVTPTGHVLHRVAAIEWEYGEMITGHGASVCGIQARFQMPGVLSRMGLERCARCCRLLGIPLGAGAPFNALTGGDKDA